MAENIITILPGVFFLCVLIGTFRLFKKDEITSGVFTELNISETGEQTTKKSSSRVILFLTGVTTLIIAITLLTYYLYYSFNQPSIVWLKDVIATKIKVTDIEVQCIKTIEPDIPMLDALLKKMKAFSDIKMNELNNIMQILIYLGIGIVPYGANQLKGLFK